MLLSVASPNLLDFYCCLKTLKHIYVLIVFTSHLVPYGVQFKFDACFFCLWDSVITAVCASLSIRCKYNMTKNISSVELISKQVKEFALIVSGNIFFYCERADSNFLLCPLQCIYELSSVCWKPARTWSVFFLDFTFRVNNVGFLPATCAPYCT